MPRPDMILAARHLHPDPMPCAVPPGARSRIGKQILVAQVLENLVEHRAELDDVLGEERASAADRREPSEQVLQLRRVYGPPLTDRVDRRVAAFCARDGCVHRRVARLVVPVAEDDDRTAALLAAEQIDRLDRHVIERRAAPRRHQIDRPHACTLVGRTSRRRENVVVEAEHRHLVVRLEAREKTLG